VFTEGCIGVRIMARLCTTLIGITLTLIGTIIIGIDALSEGGRMLPRRDRRGSEKSLTSLKPAV
jgi:hypothetical protein